MRSRANTVFCLAFFAALSLAAPVAAPAAIVEVRPGIQMTDLSGVWKFHPGDDLAWASPGLDDSNWPDIKIPGLWERQGYPELNGIAWYRLTVQLPPATGETALLVGPVQMGYELYINGNRLGAYPSDFRRGAARSQSRAWPIPPSIAGAGPLVIAFRVIGDERGSGFSPTSSVVVGARAGIEALASNANYLMRLRGLPWYLYPFAFIFVPIMLALYFSQPDRGEYLWAAGFAFFQAVFGVVELYAAHSELLSLLTFARCSILLNLAMMWARIELTVFLFGEKRLRWVRAAQWITAAVVLATVLHGGVASMIYSYEELTFLPFRLAIVWVAIRQLRSTLWESRTLAVLLLLEFFLALPTELRLAGRALEGAILPGVNIVYVSVFGLFAISLSGLINISWMLLITGLVLRRYVVTSREHRRLADELEAARLVQALLIPKNAPETPGFVIDSVYLPAHEVGGDFYQVLPGPDDSIFVVVGDVSGKGLKAAMVVSSIVGGLLVVQSGARSRRPASVLESLNRMLVKEMDGGFVTCCCALFEAGGRVTIANAGHLPPYRNGEELSGQPGLPLGITLDSAYPEETFQMEDTDRLMFLSDGVIEARNPKGELFGFERTAQISALSASEVASAAQAFGQHDDITVLTILRDDGAK